MSRPLAPHEIAERKARKARRSLSPVLGAGILAALGCLTWIGGSALLTWIAWSFLRVYGAVLGDQHLFWVIGASAVFVLGLSLIWSAITTRGGRTPVAAEGGIDGVERYGATAGRDSASGPGDATSVDTSDTERSRQNSETNRGCSFLFGIMLMTISGSILVLPVLPQEQLLRLSILGDMVGALRADRVSEYIDEEDYESARRLGGLGLGRKTAVNALPKLSGELVLAEILLMSGADPDSRDSWGDTLLMEVSDPLFAERLLAHGASPDLRNDDGQTAGEEALERWDFGVATKLVDPTGDGEPLANAIRQGDHEELKRLLDGSTDPDSLVVLRAEYDYELSPLYYAAAFGDLRTVNLLLDAGA